MNRVFSWYRMNRVFSVFLVIAIFSIVLGYVVIPDGNSIEITAVLDYKDGIYIFLNNLFMLSIWFIFSIFALPIIFGIPFWFSMGALGKQTDTDILNFIISSIPHGPGEIFCTLLICVFTVKQFSIIYKIFRGMALKEDLKKLYVNFFKKTYPLIIVVLIFSAVLEVYVSNPLIRFLS